jgi:RNA polymerase sigma factor (sigma-70 family)
MQCSIETHLSDGELLASYGSHADQQAFSELMYRHQPMVLRVCRHMLGSGDEAEDAAQQVFIALSMKALALRDRESIASWLYRAAWNISNRIRRSRCVRKTHETLAGAMPSKVVSGNTVEPDTLSILQEALAEIPDIYSEAIVLHYFCGHTVAETAARLRCPAGTVAARVSRGLERLRARLGDRGLILSALGIKLLMLSAMGGSKAKAAAAVAKGGLSTAGPSYRFTPTRRPYMRIARALGFAPVISALAAWGRPLSAVFQVTRGTGGASPSTAAPTTWIKHILVSIDIHWKQLAPFLIVIGCVGAGTAVKGIILPHWNLTDKDGTNPTPDKSPAQAVKPAVEDSDSSNKDNSNHERYASVSPVGTAVPEPSSMCLLLGGTTALLSRRRRLR